MYICAYPSKKSVWMPVTRGCDDQETTLHSETRTDFLLVQNHCEEFSLSDAPFRFLWNIKYNLDMIIPSSQS